MYGNNYPIMKAKSLLTLALLASMSMGVAAQQARPVVLERVERPASSPVLKAPSRLQAPTAEGDKQYLINYGGSTLYALGFGGVEVRFRAMLKVKPEDAAALEGTKLTQVGYYLAAKTAYSSPGMSDFHVFVSNQPEGGNDIAAVDCTGGDISTGEHWIELDEPYTITGESFYIGYETTMAANSSGIAISVSNNDEWENYSIYQYYQDQDTGEYVWGDIGWSPDYGEIQIYGLAEGNGNVQVIDLSLLGVSAPSIVKSGESTYFNAIVQNNSIEMLDKVTVNYTANGQQGTATAAGSFVPTTTSMVQFECTLNATEDVELQTVDVSVADAEGRQDDNMADNEMSCKTNVYKEGVEFNEPRGILMEQFTTEVCQNCPSGHQIVESVISDYDADIIRVAHHAGFYTDNYTISYSNQITPFFFNMDGGTFAPAVMVGRKCYPEIPNSYYYYSPGPAFGIAAEYLQYAFDDQVSMANLMTINLETDYDQANNVLNIKVHGQSKLTLDNPTVNVFITEDGLPEFSQSGWYGPGDWVHDHVLREVLTGISGQKLEIGADGSYEYSVSWNVKDQITGMEATTDVNPENINVVAFVGNYDSSDPNNCEVFNAAINEKVLSSGIGGAAELDGVSVYSNGGEVLIEGSFDGAEVYTVDGLLVRSVGQSDGMTSVQGLNAGVYMVKVNAGGNSSVAKVLVD